MNHQGLYSMASLQEVMIVAADALVRTVYRYVVQAGFDHNSCRLCAKHSCYHRIQLTINYSLIVDNS